MVGRARRGARCIARRCSRSGCGRVPDFDARGLSRSTGELRRKIMSEERAAYEISRETCFIPATHQGKGRRRAVAPGSTATRFLHYGRITLGATDEAVSFQTGEHETGLICLAGKASVKTSGETFEVGRYDAVYVPRDSDVEISVSGSEGCDIAEISAPVANKYPLQFVPFTEVRSNPKLHV